MIVVRSSLADALERIENQITLPHVLAICQQMCAGMEVRAHELLSPAGLVVAQAIAAHGIVHGDLALRNLLLFRWNTAMTELE